MGNTFPMDLSFLNAENLTAVVTLTAMEIILGIDNIVFLSILVDRLPRDQQAKIRALGLSLALFLRIGLLFSITWLMGLTRPLFEVWGWMPSGRDFILLGGGLFLVGKSTFEIHQKVEGREEEHPAVSHGGPVNGTPVSVVGTLIQILILDVVFSLDSVITAVGMTQHFGAMVVAVVLAVLVMLVFAGAVGHFVNTHPTVKVLALAFLILIGVMLLVEGMGGHINRGYIYFAMFFSLAVELLNLRARKKRALS